MKPYAMSASTENRKTLKGERIKIWGKSTTLGLCLLGIDFLFIVFFCSPGYGKDTVNVGLIRRYGHSSDMQRVEIFQHNKFEGNSVYSFRGEIEVLLIIDGTDLDNTKEAAFLEIGSVFDIAFYNQAYGANKYALSAYGDKVSYTCEELLPTGWFALHKGLTIFAHPGADPNTIWSSELLERLRPENIKKIIQYASNTNSYRTCYFDGSNKSQCSYPDEQRCFQVVSNKAYALYMKRKRVIDFSILPSNLPIDLQKGINWIGIPSPPLEYRSYSMLQDLGSPEEVAGIMSYDPQTTRWLTTYWKYGQPAGDNFPIQTGQGYIVSMKKEKLQWLPREDMVGPQGETVSHATHTQSNTKGPATAMDCGDCHDTDNYPYFGDPGDAESLADTSVCDGCHSAGGAYNGVNNNAGSIGAKDNWNDVYDPNNRDVLLAGKEKWCIGCHDGGMSVIEGVSAPKIDLYYTNGHGRSGVTKECPDCHDTTRTHIDGEARTYSFDSAYYAPAQSGVAYAEGYRLVYIGGDVPLMIPANYNITFGYDVGLMKDNAFRLCFNCHDTIKLLDDTPGDGISSNFSRPAESPTKLLIRLGKWRGYQ